MDNLTYAYDGNKLNQVSDGISATDNEVDFIPRGSGNYTYYTDGSLKSDENETISLILYDTYLKQPKEIQLADGRKINHYYDGSGALLKTLYSTGEYWEYGEVIYKNGQPYQLSTPGGRAIYQSSSWQYEFFYTDHLGNTRAAFRANGNQLLKSSETAFDPWGVVLRGAGQENGVSNRFEYQNKEKESTFNLNRINLGARTLNPTIGRFDRVDPLADQMRRWSTYNYAFGNPLRFIDPDGMEAQQAEDFVYSDGYSTQSYRNSTGRIAVSGNYDNLNTTEDPPSLLQRLLNYFGFFTKPESKEEAKTYADRRQSLNELNERNEKAQEEILEKTEYIPLLGSAAKMSKAMQDKNGVVMASVSFALDATGGGGVPQKLTNGGKKVLGSLVNMIEMTLSEGVLQRGGKIGNLSVVDDALKGMTILEVANLAATGDQKAQTAIKILKQASSKAQKY